MAKLYIGNTKYKVMLGNNSAHFARGEYQNISNNNFISRTTGGGNLTIDATNGKVLKIEGNSVAWNQIVGISTTKTTTCYGVTIIWDNVNDTITLNGTATGTGFHGGDYKYGTTTPIQQIQGRKYYAKAIFNKSTNVEITGNSAYIVSPPNDGTTTIGTCDKTNNSLVYRVGVVDGTTYDNVVIKMNVLDLTLLNYPNIATTTPTVAQVEEWLANNVELKDYYPYDEGSILNVKMLGIKTTLPNTWTETKDFDVTRVYGKLNGEGSYVQVYPDGMRGVNDVKDVLYLNEDRAEVKCGNVDLGTLLYIYVSGVRFYTSGISNLIPKREGNENFVSSLFIPTNDLGVVSVNSNRMWTSVIGNVSFSTNGYTDATTFKTAMQGVPLIYELATPLTYTNLMYDQSQAKDGSDLIPLSVLTYRVDVNGTEEIIRPTSVNGEPTSLAPTMDIKYINANIK